MFCAIIRQTDRQTDRVSLSFSAAPIYRQQARPARSVFGQGAPFRALTAGGDTG